MIEREKKMDLSKSEYNQMLKYSQEVFLPRFFKGVNEDIDFVKEKNYFTLYFKNDNVKYYLEFHKKELEYSVYFSVLNRFPKVEISEKKNLEKLIHELNKNMRGYLLTQIYDGFNTNKRWKER
jgi:hypothetical protein